MKVTILRQTIVPDVGRVWPGETVDIPDEDQAKHLVKQGIAEKADKDAEARAPGNDEYKAQASSAAFNEVRRQELYTASLHGDVRAARELVAQGASLPPGLAEQGTPPPLTEVAPVTTDEPAPKAAAAPEAKADEKPAVPARQSTGASARGALGR